METPDMNRRAYEERAKIIKALAHPSRLMMVDALVDGEKCVCELTELVGSDMSTVSKHLTLMREAGIVEDRKVGQQVFYSLRCPCIVSFFGCVETVMKSIAQEKMELVG
jgi:DNA-binding transcriptional ArsR family regulator